MVQSKLKAESWKNLTLLNKLLHVDNFRDRFTEVMNDRPKMGHEIRRGIRPDQYKQLLETKFEMDEIVAALRDCHSLKALGP